MTDQEKVIIKLQKLLAKANDVATTQAEAEAFMAKVQELLNQHNMSEDVLYKDIKEKDNFDPVDENQIKVTYPQKWFRQMATALAGLYFCRFYSIETKKNSYIGVFVGRKDNRTTAIFMYDYLMKSMRKMALKYPLDDRYEFMKGFCWGAVVKIIKLIEEAKSPFQFSNLPAIISKEQESNDKFIKENVQFNTTTRSNRVVKSNKVTQEGFVQGNSVSFNSQVGSSTNQASKLIR